ncbi:MAG: ABC transporter substrate-binding protein [Candidatus Methanospirareceae archaeon]
MKKIIAIVISTVLLSSLITSPVIAAQNKVASEIKEASPEGGALTLEIYGNANEDDTIDMRDVTYIKLVIFRKKPKTMFCDANHDGKISGLDVVQTKLIILGKEAKLTLIDSADRTVTVKKPIKRVVVFSEALETLRSIKATDKVVGVNKYVIRNKVFFPEFHDYPNVGSVWSPDIEKALELKPDLVFLYATFSVSYCDDIQNKLQTADPSITVLRFDNYRPGDIYVKETLKMGYVLNKVKEAKEFMDFYREYMNTIKERVAKLSDEDKPRVYLECWRDWHTATKRAGWGQKLEMAGGYNIFGDEPGEYIDVDPEAVIRRDPEIIVFIEKKAGGYEVDAWNTTVLREIRDKFIDPDNPDYRPELATTTAVKNKKVYVITNHVIGGTRNFIGIGYMAKWFHPELFKDLNPKAIHQEYLIRFQGLDIDLDKKGVFVYPEPQ